MHFPFSNYGRYRRVFQYLLKLKRTQMELEKSWAAVMHQDHTQFALHRKDRTKCSPYQQRRLQSRSRWRVREHMAFLIRNLQFYIQVTTLLHNLSIMESHELQFFLHSCNSWKSHCVFSLALAQCNFVMHFRLMLLNLSGMFCKLVSKILMISLNLWISTKSE